MFQPLFGDAEMGALLEDRAAIAAMLRAEAALAQAQARLGIIPEDAASAIAAAAGSLRPDPVALGPGVARAGIAAQPVIAALKEAVGVHAAWVHFGATSQDIVDTGLVLQLTEATALLRDRLSRLIALLSEKAAKYADLPIPAHTRFQTAAPTTLGAKIAIWAAPLQRQSERLEQLLPRLLVLSLFGAAGSAAALGPQVDRLRQDMADRLGIGVTEMPWHSSRDNIAELAGWLAMLTGALGKVGVDLVLLSQSELAQLSAGTGGASSTMPQKSNPVAAETLVTLARLNAGDLGTLHQAMVHANERDGSALGIEWSVFPAMLERAAASLRIALDLAATLRADEDRIAQGFAADRGVMMSETAGFILCREMPRAEALTIVAQALREVEASPDLTLAAALSRVRPDHDWASLLAPEVNIGQAAEIARQPQSPREDDQT
ncbi:lyase family protein [Paracoccus sediminicola]|uniref:lyase family protein n=1 Tax=Paracoccus sediminicola TaxID=3017783 RepID=UPI0022F05F63|nr:lyase family protein [Paracoccus sediminicola]WBU56661.1 lyase family protein [Paracoccus sediminicola]